MLLYQRLEYLSYRFKFESIYQEMKYHLKRILKSKEDGYLKFIGHYDRAIGKSVALARLSVKYNIPIIVPTHMWKVTIEKDIPRYLPKYFKYKKPTAIVLSNSTLLNKYPVLLLEEGFNQSQINKLKETRVNLIGYENIN